MVALIVPLIGSNYKNLNYTVGTVYRLECLTFLTWSTELVFSEKMLSQLKDRWTFTLAAV